MDDVRELIAIQQELPCHWPHPKRDGACPRRFCHSLNPS